jgi:hypothetical protein
MSETLETAIDAVNETNVIRIPGTVVLGVTSLAVYGAQDLTRKGINKVKQIRSDRKAKQALKETEPRRSQA